MQLFRAGGGDEKQHIAAALVLGERAVHGEVIHQALGGVNAVAVLIVVGGVVGVGDEENVVVRVFRAHRVIADDGLPVAAPVVPADHDGLAFAQPALNVIEPDAVGVILGGYDIKTAYAVENINGLIERGAGIALELGAVERVAQRREGLLVPVAELIVPVQHHQCRRHTAGPLAGLLHGLEVGQHGQRVGRLHVVDVGMGKVGRVFVVAAALHRIRAVLCGEVDSVGDLHFISKVFGSLRCLVVLGIVSRCVIVGAAGQKAQHEREGERQSDGFFHCKSPFLFRGRAPYSDFPRHCAE